MVSIIIVIIIIIIINTFFNHYDYDVNDYIFSGFMINLVILATSIITFKNSSTTEQKHRKAPVFTPWFPWTH